MEHSSCSTISIVGMLSDMVLLLYRRKEVTEMIEWLIDNAFLHLHSLSWSDSVE